MEGEVIYKKQKSNILKKNAFPTTISSKSFSMNAYICHILISKTIKINF